ncbi:MAG: hypothetical protein AMQ74_01857 [Candidatus Methanofastidiosum methylothiophilum]|uniref:Uncharacterized protein n=1 Tax=Candidatus Methanofastidiosum methylothiophilum TaxID=1705564 RepID=A0A150IMR6_9EURY|nr:MAG: hypothetical protein AMQ74_01857 [Candidatus Methanofastidiosum methylthiophilus]
MAAGEISLEYKDKYYSSKHGDISDFLEDNEMDDEKLLKAENDGDLEWTDNNWFEIIYLQRQNPDQIALDSIRGEEDDWEWEGDIAHDYDSGISLLEDYIDNEDI